MTASTLRQTYDEFPYDSLPFPESHPDRLATIGSLFGMRVAPVAGCRVLELGCAAGGNLIPLAAAFPGTQCVGIDFSAVQIGAGRAVVDALGLSNIRLDALDIMALDERLGTFDYVIAHGVYSWVPAAVQDRVLAICARHLAPHGIAYVSYNTLPGWAARSTVRAAMRLHTRQFTDPKLRVAQGRAIVEFLAEATKEDTSAYGLMVRAEAEEVRRKPDYYVLHDHLEEVNEAVYFRDFMERATPHGLRYLGDSAFELMFTHDLAPKIADALQRIAPDLLVREQFLDFVRNRTFRRTLLVRSSVDLERRIAAARVTPLRVASRAAPVREDFELDREEGVEFRIPAGNSITTPRPATKAVLLALREHWPLALTFDEACALAAARLGGGDGLSANDREDVAGALLTAFAAGVIELHASASPFVLDAGARPTVGALPRWQAQRGNRLTNLQHRLIQVDDTTRRMLQWLDGTRSRQEIAAAAFAGAHAPQAQALLDEALPQLGRHALLVA